MPTNAEKPAISDKISSTVRREGGTGTRSNRGREDNFQRITKNSLQCEGEGGIVTPMHWTKRITQNIRGETRAFIRARLAPAQNLNLAALERSGALK